MSKGFVSTMRKGFHMTFENGLVASVQWGAGNYCDNHDSMDFTCRNDMDSDTAEVAVIYKGKIINANIFASEEYSNSCDDVIGWLTPENVVDFLCRVKNATEKEIKESIESTFCFFKI